MNSFRKNPLSSSRALYFLRDSTFYITLCVFFVYAAFVDIHSGVYTGLDRYLIFTLSILLFIFSLASLTLRKRVSLLYFCIILLGLFCVVANLIIHKDTLLLNWFFMVVVVLSASQKPLRSSLPLLNFLFWVAIIWSIISQFAGLNPWGFFPGQAQTHLAQGLWWRVGLFPFKTPPFSGIFAVIVLCSNLYSLKGKKYGTMNYLTVFLSLYFALFSASRTAWVILFLALIVYFFSLRGFHNNLFFLAIILSTSILTFIFSVRPDYLYFLTSVSDIFSSLLYRSTSVNDINSIDHNTRYTMFLHYMELIKNSWPLGMGRHSLLESYTGPGGSEMRAFSLIAAAGFLGIIVQILILSILRYKSLRVHFFLAIFIICSFFYSSFLHIHNFSFLALLTILLLPECDGYIQYTVCSQAYQVR